MATASAWLDGEQASEVEKLDLADFEAWMARGAPPSEGPTRRSRSLIKPPGYPEAGQVFVTTGHITPSRIARDASERGDHSLVYIEALYKLLEIEPRVRAGHAYRIEII